MADTLKTVCKYPAWMEARMALHRKEYGQIPEEGDRKLNYQETYLIAYSAGYNAGVRQRMKA